MLSTRRALLGGLAVVPFAGAAQAEPISPSEVVRKVGGKSLKFVDLSHRLTNDFNFPGPRPRIAMQDIDGSGVAVGMKLHLLSLVEHTGTHVDVPSHFDEKAASLGETPLGEFVAPLAVIDIRPKLKTDRDAALTVADIQAWERKHGRLPKGACVAIFAGWDFLAEGKRNAGLPAEERRKSPGLGVEAAKFLMEQRQIVGVAVEAGSIDTGTNGPAYPVHQEWLRSGRWGIEFITNLDKVPAAGGLIIVGAAPIKDATGIPIRAIAVF